MDFQGKHFYLIGIGGMGMSAIAIILKEQGFSVTGSDQKESHMTHLLNERGISIDIGHHEDHITKDIDVVVFTSAISKTHCEYKKAKKLGIALYERAQFLNLLTLQKKCKIGISGSHGKTTTTSLTSKIFLQAGKEPTLAIGGFLKDINGTGYSGKGECFIYESCEAYGSMLSLHPDLALVTNIDEDHMDFYKNIENLKKAFLKYLQENTSKIIVYNADDDNLKEVVQKVTGKENYSISREDKNASVFLESYESYGVHSRFTIYYQGEKKTFDLSLPGLYNIYNAMGAFLIAKLAGIKDEYIQEAFRYFMNAKRRFEIKKDGEKLTLVDDYAHHPVEVKATITVALEMAKQKKKHLIVVFQPHLYSRTFYFQKDFAKALSLADTLILPPIYAAREENTYGIESSIIYSHLKDYRSDMDAICVDSLKEAAKKIREIEKEKNIMVLTLGAGNVFTLEDYLL